jgi:hypothetical protein
MMTRSNDFYLQEKELLPQLATFSFLTRVLISYFLNSLNKIIFWSFSPLERVTVPKQKVVLNCNIKPRSFSTSPKPILQNYSSSSRYSALNLPQTFDGADSLLFLKLSFAFSISSKV